MSSFQLDILRRNHKYEIKKNFTSAKTPARSMLIYVERLIAQKKFQILFLGDCEKASKRTSMGYFSHVFI